MNFGSKRRFVLSMATAICCSSGLAEAAPLVNVQVLGSTNSGATYSSAIAVAPGQTINFEVEAQMAPIGTVNSHGTITSLVSGTDGIGSVSITLLNNGSNPIEDSIASEALVSPFDAGTGASAGTPTSVGGGTNNELMKIRGILATGVPNQGTASESIIESGTFTIDTAPANATSQVMASFGGTLSTVKINDGTVITVTTTTEASSDPVVGYTALTLNTPEPATLGLWAGAATIGLLMRRRRSNNPAGPSNGKPGGCWCWQRQNVL